MSSNTINTQVRSEQTGLRRATVEQQVVKETTAVSTGVERVVVTRRQEGELKLRYSPIESQTLNSSQSSTS